MGDEKETWKVKTLDEILLEKKRRRELEEKIEPKCQKNFVQCPVPQADDREAKRDTPEEGELRDQRMEITIRNSPYSRDDSTEDRGEEDESLAIKPPQQMARKDKSHHRKEEKRKDKRRHRSDSAEGAGKQVRPKEKERESDRRKRQWEEDKARRDWERQKRREQARAHSRRERDRLEQLERQRERDRKIRDQQQKEQRDLKDRERRAEERRKDREARREVPSHHRALPEEYDDKLKQSHRSRSPTRLPRDRSDHSSETRRSATSKEEKPEDKDLLADLQDISDSERKTSTAESSLASGSGSEEEEEDEEESSSQSEGEEEEEESGSASGRSDRSAEDVSEDEHSEEEFEKERENGNHIPT
ncbi:cyclin-dependent kinase 11B-like, partial [Diretmus argenteus]